jgi:uncharacterized membrane protein YeaQ/YmgE (transglycosylase-associated protein family)
MSVIAWIVIGLLAGWLATRIMGGRGGLMRNLAVGLVGAIVGGFLFEKLKLEVVPDFWGNLIHRNGRSGRIPAHLAGDPERLTRLAGRREQP